MGYTGIDPLTTGGLRRKETTEYAVQIIGTGGELYPTTMKETFDTPPLCYDDGGYGDPTGTTGDENRMYVGHNYFEYHILGTQTLLAPAWDANGLNIAFDQTADDGVEFTNGITARSKMAFNVSNDNCYFEVTLNIADASGSDDLCVGFRKAEAYQAAVDNYDEAAYFAWDGTNLDIETILNGGTTSNIDTGDAIEDGVDITLRVEIVNRKATFKVDGAAPSTTATFTFDASEVVIPFVYMLQGTDLTGAAYIKNWECGKLYNV